MTSVAQETKANRLQSREISTYTASFGLSLGITSLFNAFLVIIKETNQNTVLAWMKVAGHHWVTQGVLDIVVFVALGFFLARVSETWRSYPSRITATTVGGVLAGALIIAAFFLQNA